MFPFITIRYSIQAFKVFCIAFALVADSGVLLAYNRQSKCVPSSMKLSCLSVHDWCNKGRGMCYPVCGMVHIKEPLLLIDKSSLCGGSGFPFSLSEWFLTICLTPYNRR